MILNLPQIPPEYFAYCFLGRGSQGQVIAHPYLAKCDADARKVAAVHHGKNGAIHGLYVYDMHLLAWRHV